MMILVTGAAGKTGLEVIRATAGRGEHVRALVRREEQSEFVTDAGAAEPFVGDMTHKSTFDEALRGVDVVYHICPNVSPYEVEIGCSMITTCLEQEVERIIYHSVLHPQTEDMPHHWAKLQVEQQLLRSGLDFTILQPSAYMQNLQGSWKKIIEEGIFTVPYPVETRINMVDLRDVAEVAAEVIVKREYSGAIFELAGPESLRQDEVAQILTEELGFRVAAQEESPMVWRTRMEGMTLGDYQLSTLIQMFAYYAKNSFIGNDTVLRHLLQREPTSFRSFVHRMITELGSQGVRFS